MEKRFFSLFQTYSNRKVIHVVIALSVVCRLHSTKNRLKCVSRYHKMHSRTEWTLMTQGVAVVAHILGI